LAILFLDIFIGFAFAVASGFVARWLAWRMENQIEK
jgi:hypothetical protein